MALFMCRGSAAGATAALCTENSLKPVRPRLFCSTMLCLKSKGVNRIYNAVHALSRCQNRYYLRSRPGRAAAAFSSENSLKPAPSRPFCLTVCSASPAT